ncbi:hypothetical protein QYF61_012340 [Mycteria americana]|uniref:Uncharacterized protein n=1 Tax=Mycteria americana TaxID=33587 RepID=A0AAN7S6U8_MYCAM|nr:hypothetical protein QYF61_012340 [Mycteria americana]
MKGLEHLSYRERLRAGTLLCTKLTFRTIYYNPKNSLLVAELGLFSLEKGKHRRNFTNVYKYLMGNNEDKGVKLFSVVLTDRTRGKRHKLKHMKFHLNTRKKIL